PDRRSANNRPVHHTALQQEQLAPADAALVASVKMRSHCRRLELGQLSVDFRTQGLEGWAAHLSPPWSMPPSAASVCSETSSWARARASRERTVPTGHSTICAISSYEKPAASVRRRHLCHVSGSAARPWDISSLKVLRNISSSRFPIGGSISLASASINCNCRSVRR